MPTYTGTSASNAISGSEDADTLSGLAGNDTLFGLGVRTCWMAGRTVTA